MHQGVSTDFPIAAVRPLSRCLLRVLLIRLFLRYTSIVNLRVFYSMYTWFTELISTTPVNTCSDLLYNVPLSTPLPVLVVAVTRHPFKRSMLHSAWRHTGKSSWRKDCCGEEVRGFSDTELAGSLLPYFLIVRQLYNLCFTSTWRFWMGLTHNIYI